ncbi:MAG: N-acetyltransferase [Pseudomonadota bacterium]
MISIRQATAADQNAIWRILEPVFRAGDTYTIDPNVSREDALAYWLSPSHTTFVAEEGGDTLGTYYVRPNQGGNGDHVANCGYITSETARGRGVARAMLEHSLKEAPRAGYQAMQFNFVVATNVRAVETWKRYGFEIIGSQPLAFRHPVQGLVDAYVMYKKFDL